jgi:hypothetical protein
LILIIKLIFTLIFFKCRPSGCASVLDFSYERIFRGANCSSVVLDLRRNSSPERHFRGSKVRLLQQRSSESKEDCSGGVLEPRWSNFSAESRFLSTWSAVIALRKTFQHRTGIYQYTMKLFAGLPNLVRLLLV